MTTKVLQHGAIMPEAPDAGRGGIAAEPVARDPAEDVADRAAETFGGNLTESFGAPILDMDQGDLTAIFSAALRSEYGEKRHAKKSVASAANCNLRAAENWLDGKNTPDLLHGLRLAVTVPAWRAELRRLLALDAEPSSEAEREIALFVARFQHYLGAKP